MLRPQAMASPRAPERQGAGMAGSPWLAKKTIPAFHSPHQRTTTALLYGFCFEHSDVGTCGHSCLRRPLRQNQTELPGCSFCQPLCFQALKYQSSLKKATEVEIRFSVSTGERVRPLDLWGSGLTHPLATSSCQQIPSLEWAEWPVRMLGQAMPARTHRSPSCSLH